MSSSATLHTRPRWYKPTIATAVVAIAAFSTIAWFVDDEPTETVLGALTGATFMALLGLIAIVEMTHRTTARQRESEALDNLEPLRAAVSDDYATRTTESAHDDATQSASTDTRPGRDEAGR